MNEEEIFQVAAGMPAPEREAYLLTACVGQPALRERVERLLASHDDDGFMQRPVDRTDSAEVEAELARLKPEEGDDRIGNYKLLQKIGEGGFGTVWMAEQLEPVRRRVALKIIKPGMDSKEVIVRFEQERQALALMDHPNIAKVLDAGVTPLGRPFFVMELVRGIRITDFCDQNNLPTPARLDLFIAVCHAIQHAHQKGIIHRDIKPSNILVTLHDGVPVPKVIDFGVAKAIQSQRLTDLTFFTRFEQMIGTPLYMSPEQAEMSGLDIDTRSDIYSLGVLLYELLTGKTPFDPRELMALGIDAMRKTIRETEPVRPSTRLTKELVAAEMVGRVTPCAPPVGVSSLEDGAHGVTRPTSKSEEEVRASSRRLLRIRETITLLRGDLDWIVMKCLEKDRSRRYDTATGLAADLKRHLNDEPVIARPPSTAYKLQKAWRRNKLAFTALGFVLAALVIGLATTFWQWRRAEGIAVKEHHERERAVTGESKLVHQLYVANMNLIQAAWEQNNVSRMRRLLDETASASQRGFEWYYWQRQMHLELRALRGHTGPILAVAYSPDGRRIVTGSADKTARVWDAASGSYLFSLNGHTNSVRSVAFSPDGQRIVTGSWDRTVRVWEAATGKHLRSIVANGKELFSVAFSPDGQRIVTGGQEEKARVWDANSGKELFPLEGHTNLVWAVAFSRDGQWIVTGSWDQTARVWNAATGEHLRTLVGHRGAILSVAFSPDGQRVVTGGQDHRAKVWDAASGTNLFTLKGHSAAVFSVSYSRDGQRILTSSDDQTARLWDAASGEELRVFKGHGSRIGSAALSPDGQRIVTGGGAVRFAPEGIFFNPTTGDDQAAKVWDATDTREVLTLSGHEKEVVSIDISADGSFVASGSFDGTARVWDIRTGQEVSRMTGHESAVRGVAFFPDGKAIVTGGFDGTARIWDIASRREIHRLEGHTARVFSVAVSPDSRWIATSGWDHTVRVWDAVTGQQRHKFNDPAPYVYGVAFSPDSRQVGSANVFGMARFWDPISGREYLGFRDTRNIWSLAFSRDGRRIVTGSHGLIAKVWDAASGQRQIDLEGHAEHIMTAVFSSDGRRIVTGSADQTAKLWDAVTGSELLTLKGHSGPVFSVAFTPDGQRIVTASGDRTVKVWEAASEELAAKWHEEGRKAAAVKQAPENPH